MSESNYTSGSSVIRNDKYSDAVNLYADMLFRISYLHLYNKNDAEDIVQEVFIKLLSSQKRFVSYEHQKAWLIRVTINLCHDHTRHTRTKNFVSLSEALNASFSSHENQILEEVMSLPNNYKDVIYLFYYEGYKIHEIADMLGKNESTIGTWLVRARQQLKNIISEENTHV